MKFAFLIFKYFPFGGVQRDMLRIALDCAGKGHEVTIYTGEWRGEQPAGIRVVKLRGHGLFNHSRHQSLIAAMQRELARDVPDLVLGFNRMPGLDAYYAADPCFIERARHERGWWYRWTGRYHFFADTERAVMAAEGDCRILLLSPREKTVFQHWYRTPDRCFYQLPPNIPAQHFSHIDRQQARHHLRQEFGLPQKAKVVLMVGSAFVRKGLDRVIVSLGQLPADIRAQTWLLAVGEDEAASMRQLAGQHGVADRVIITGGRSDVPALMMGADLLAHAARSELAGLVITEALTAGLPVLTTDVCGYAVHVKDAGAGIVLDSPFVQAMCDQALLHMLSSSQWQEWSAAAKRYTQAILMSSSATVEADLLEQFAGEKKIMRQAVNQ